MTSFLSPMPRVFAHRGDSANYPENTLEAFLSATRKGADAIETDVRLTLDGHIVVSHDERVERNTDGSGIVEKMTLEEIKRLDAGYTFTKDGKSYPFRGKGIRICTLEEALLALPDQRFNIDLKTKNTAIVPVYIDLIRRLKAENRVCTASFNLENLKAVRSLAPDFLTSLTTKEVLPLLLRQKLHILPETFPRKYIFQLPRNTIATRSFVRKMHALDAVVMVWTVNSREKARRLYSIGVDTVMTDDPASIVSLVRELELN